MTPLVGFLYIFLAQSNLDKENPQSTSPIGQMSFLTNLNSWPCRTVIQGVVVGICLPKTAWPPTSAISSTGAEGAACESRIVAMSFCEPRSCSGDLSS